MSIFHDGILVDVNVCYWSGTRMLTAEDLGLKPDEVSKAFKLGKKNLIPEDIMRGFWRIESRARNAVTDNSYPFPIGNSYFVPYSKFIKVSETLEKCRDEYNTLIEDLVLNYEEYKLKMVPVYREAAELAYMTQKPSGVEEFSIEGQEAERETYVQAFLRRIEAFYPPVDVLRTKFSLSWVTYKIALAEEKTVDGMLIEDIKEEEKQKQLEDQAKQDEDTRRKIAIEEYQRQTQAKIGGFVDEAVKVLRHQTIEFCDSVIKNMNDGKAFTAKTLNRIKNYIDHFKEMNFIGDTTVEEHLEKLNNEFLKVYKPDQITEIDELQTELQRRLTELSQAAAQTTDVSNVTGEYNRRVIWRKKAA